MQQLMVSHLLKCMHEINEDYLKMYNAYGNHALLIKSSISGIILCNHGNLLTSDFRDLQGPYLWGAVCLKTNKQSMLTKEVDVYQGGRCLATKSMFSNQVDV